MKQFYRIYLLVFGLAVAPAVKAQTTFTLEQCVDFALKNTIDAQNATIDEQIADARVKETIGIGLPQISGAVSLTHNNKLRRFFGLYNDSPDGFSFFPSGIPGAQNGDVLAAQNFFQLKSSGEAGLNINQMIFNGSYLVGLQAANAFKDQAAKSSLQTREQIIQNVTKAYYTVLINRERLTLFNSNIARLDTLLRNTRALYQNGFAEKIDVDRIQVTFNNLRTERDKFTNLNELGVALLKFQMNYPQGEPLIVAGTIEEVEVPSLESYQLQNDYSMRPDYQVLESNRRLQQLNVKNKYAEGMPSISAFANLGYATQSNNISGLFKTNSNVPDLGTVGPDKWYGYSSFGVNLNVPIFSGLQRSFKLQQEKLTLRKIENGFTKLKSGIDLEVKQAAVNYDNALKALASQKENMELAGSVARVTKIKYEQGVGSNLEVIDAEDALKQAQINYYNAMFDAMIAKVDLDKAYGKILTK
ncbi:MAG: TolC family protein [Cyclobacteriaceae bacterium]|nr:TolC family protein [Cyclobacteriaceae bacterium]